jgi:hypothetical protein
MGIFVVWRSTTVRAGVGEWEREKKADDRTWMPSMFVSLETCMDGLREM